MLIKNLLKVGMMMYFVYGNDAFVLYFFKVEIHNRRGSAKYKTSFASIFILQYTVPAKGFSPFAPCQRLLQATQLVMKIGRNKGVRIHDPAIII